MDGGRNYDVCSGGGGGGGGGDSDNVCFSLIQALWNTSGCFTVTVGTVVANYMHELFEAF
jgi:hypothetical protein